MYVNAIYTARTHGPQSNRDAALAHAVDERLHAAVEEALGLGALGQERADAARGGPVVALGVLRFDALVERRRRADGVTLLIVDDLGVDVVVRPEHVQAQAALVLVGDALSPVVQRVCELTLGAVYDSAQQIARFVKKGLLAVISGWTQCY
jgi:hypothetical protein